jgi:hypothetical protein
MKSTVFKIVNKKVIHITNRGIGWSLLICLIAIFILELYCECAIPQAFYIGIPLFKSALFFIVMFIICGFIFDKIAN